jgi:hypothetical protein
VPGSWFNANELTGLQEPELPHSGVPARRMLFSTGAE